MVRQQFFPQVAANRTLYAQAKFLKCRCWPQRQTCLVQQAFSIVAGLTFSQHNTPRPNQLSKAYTARDQTSTNWCSQKTNVWSQMLITSLKTLHSSHLRVSLRPFPTLIFKASLMTRRPPPSVQFSITRATTTWKRHCSNKSTRKPSWRSSNGSVNSSTTCKRPTDGAKNSTKSSKICTGTAWTSRRPTQQPTANSLSIETSKNTTKRTSKN